MLYLILGLLGFMTGILLGIVFVLTNKVSANDIQKTVKKMTKSTEKAFIVEDDNMNALERILQIKPEQK